MAKKNAANVVGVKTKTTWKQAFKRDWQLYLLLLLPLIMVFVFSYGAYPGLRMAFMDYKPAKGYAGSEWVGMKTFVKIFKDADFMRALRNSIVFNLADLIIGFPMPIILALILNELRYPRFKKVSQTILYLPHFLSWVILASVLLEMFGYKGVINSILGVFGIQGKIWFSEENCFRQLVIGSDVWKEFGFNAVIYLAALTGISPELYEAAAIDGCSRWKAVWNITIPGIASTIVVLSILGLGNVLNAGFDQVFNLYSPLVYSTGDILDTWVYRMGLLNVQFSLATAAGLFKSVISFTLIVISYIVAYKAADYKIF